ncbi:MAG TPA: serine/threonine-protein kinase [Pirellulales bacterium]|nr:serine/threonine-protein kinase [Pirellulales bacterium]
MPELGQLRIDPPAQRPAHRLGRWELTSAIGEGALCRVYRARPAAARERPAGYAVKVLRERWQHHPAAIATIAREAEVGRAVSHPHLGSVLDARCGGPPYFVVMPCLAGTTLDRLLAAGPLPLAASLWYARQTAEALAALDAAGWMHGDVKPANVLVGPDGHVTLIDLGFARRPGEIGSVLDRCVLGSIHYLAPETFVSALRLDIRSDIYSLGVMLYELLTGRRPFEGRDLAAIGKAHRHQRPRNLRSLVPELPSGVASLVHRMLAKEPLRRPQSPDRLVHRLAGFEIDNLACR